MYNVTGSMCYINAAFHPLALLYNSEVANQPFRIQNLLQIIISFIIAEIFSDYRPKKLAKDLERTVSQWHGSINPKEQDDVTAAISKRLATLHSELVTRGGHLGGRGAADPPPKLLHIPLKV